MSLGYLARYDGTEDEIRDEDHNLMIVPPQLSVFSKPPVEEAIEPDPFPQVDVKAPPPPPPVMESNAKPKTLVAYDDMSDDDMSESDIEEDEEQKIILPAKSKEKQPPKSKERQSKESVINLGLFDGTSVLNSSESDTSRLSESYGNSPKPETVALPPEPDGRCSKSLQEKIAKMIEKKNAGNLNVNEYVQQKKGYRNPSIYEKLITFIGIDEHGTNYPKKLYDPSIWGPESYYDELAKKQKEYHKEKEKEKLKKTHVEFVTATKKPATSQAPVNSAPVPEKRSKWDQKIPPPPKPITGPPKITPAIQAAAKNINKL